ncbi:hypothetical protein KFL_000060930 [Klebsormidium nitens]|uniref:Uncharacterized protein n=1 Tax=Klebsormidium nitens TaxID=105231 RepID=A0A0U9HQQ2_KLENI|nr:hypothetical protein KFL_000060930 [Klebsormidium nitens]|eukprot:GAQ78027.1 hypothetical protein KFL_000060930 [Klebsormidium nitens]
MAPNATQTLKKEILEILGAPKKRDYACPVKTGTLAAQKAPLKKKEPATLKGMSCAPTSLQAHLLGPLVRPEKRYSKPQKAGLPLPRFVKVFAALVVALALALCFPPPATGLVKGRHTVASIKELSHHRSRSSGTGGAAIRYASAQGSQQGSPLPSRHKQKPRTSEEELIEGGGATVGRRVVSKAGKGARSFTAVVLSTAVTNIHGKIIGAAVQIIRLLSGLLLAFALAYVLTTGLKNAWRWLVAANYGVTYRPSSPMGDQVTLVKVQVAFSGSAAQSFDVRMDKYLRSSGSKLGDPASRQGMRRISNGTLSSILLDYRSDWESPNGQMILMEREEANRELQGWAMLEAQNSKGPVGHFRLPLRALYGISAPVPSCLLLVTLLATVEGYLNIQNHEVEKKAGANLAVALLRTARIIQNENQVFRFTFVTKLVDAFSVELSFPKR